MYSLNVSDFSYYLYLWLYYPMKKTNTLHQEYYLDYKNVFNLMSNLTFEME